MISSDPRGPNIGYGRSAESHLTKAERIRIAGLPPCNGGRCKDFHPLADKYPLLEGDEFAAFKDSIKTKGQRVSIVLFEEKILDGRNRERACRELGINPYYVNFQGTTEEASTYSDVLNLHRRHLTRNQIRKVISFKLKQNPDQSDRSIAAEVKVDHKTVAAVREKEKSTIVQDSTVQLGQLTVKQTSTGEIPQLTVKQTSTGEIPQLTVGQSSNEESAPPVRIGRDGRKRRRRRTFKQVIKSPSPAESQPENPKTTQPAEIHYGRAATVDLDSSASSVALMKDRKGRIVPPNLVEAFAWGNALSKDAKSRLDELWELIETASKNPHGLPLQGILNPTEIDFRNIREAVASSMPYCVCPNLADTGEHHQAGSCKTCHDRGYITRNVYQQLNENLKKLCTERDEPRAAKITATQSEIDDKLWAISQ